MGNLFSTLTKLNIQTQDTIQGNGKVLDAPKFTSTEIKQLTLDYTTSIVYFVLCIVIILACDQLEFSDQTTAFFTLGITYAFITISLSAESMMFVMLEVIAWGVLVELASLMDYELLAWFMVFILPILTIAQSIYYLLFYLS
ncbi:MAG: hypothetical protein CMF82_03910 [Candidatus Marinimicrobia bacterium]|nr:hypothetical protein [Candidatus Neomarinimicrobiota bacterium]|tara:strand:+ start:14486 stop:14911 length:426 start_codon:yes stop_codon:yes gene_type:complete